MAIYHCSIKTISRSKGRSATAAAAYRSGEKIKDERLGETFDYTKKKGVIFKEIIFPENIEKLSREKLWNIAEEKETRKNSTVAREYELALPAELNEKIRAELAVSFAKKIVENYGVAADVCLHEPDKNGDEKNYHAHILTTTRVLKKDGLADKTRVLDVKKSGEVEKIRKLWADILNKELIKNGFEKVSEKSLKEQEIEREPQIHVGVTASNMEKRGVKTERGNINRAIKKRNKDTEELLFLKGLGQKINIIKEMLLNKKPSRDKEKKELEEKERLEIIEKSEQKRRQKAEEERLDTLKRKQNQKDNARKDKVDREPAENKKRHNNRLKMR